MFIGEEVQQDNERVTGAACEERPGSERPQGGGRWERRGAEVREVRGRIYVGSRRPLRGLLCISRSLGGSGQRGDVLWVCFRWTLRLCGGKPWG